MPDVPRLLVLGGSSFVDRAIVEDAVSRGCRVTTFNRGCGPWSHPDPDHLIGDRLVPADPERLGSRSWDFVVDTWSGAPGPPPMKKNRETYAASAATTELVIPAIDASFAKTIERGPLAWVVWGPTCGRAGDDCRRRGRESFALVDADGLSPPPRPGTLVA